jgi:hypothetical protein
MSQVIKEIRKNIVDLTKKLFDEISGLKISIVAHGDYCDEKSTYLMKYVDFTDDMDSLIKFVKETGDTGGGDYPEAYEYVLNKVQNLAWSNTSRALIMIGDAYPHEKNQNPYKLDWRNETAELAKMGVNIYSVQALNSGNAKCYTFYKTIASITNGYHLYLNQFSHIAIIVTAIFYKQQTDESKLTNYEQELVSHGYGMNKSMRAVFDTMLGRKTEEDKLPTMYTGDDDDDEEEEEEEEEEDDAAIGEIKSCPPAKYQILQVTENCSIKDFVTANHLRFKAGKGFYEFTKPETISAKKSVILMKKDTGDLYEGKRARKIIGLTNASKKYRPHDIPEYRVFIQSTSYNRKLIGDTGFLYEADDFGAGSAITETV